MDTWINTNLKGCVRIQIPLFLPWGTAPLHPFIYLFTWSSAERLLFPYLTDTRPERVHVIILIDYSGKSVCLSHTHTQKFQIWKCICAAKWEVISGKLKSKAEERTKQGSEWEVAIEAHAIDAGSAIRMIVSDQTLIAQNERNIIVSGCLRAFFKHNPEYMSIPGAFGKIWKGDEDHRIDFWHSLIKVILSTDGHKRRGLCTFK